jgi:hypothetical protein
MLLSFRKLVCVSTACVALLGVVFLSSCSDDDPAKDTVIPEVSFSNLTDGSNVWNTVSMSVNATDNDGVEKVEIYIDGALTSTLTASPFDLSWDTNTATDGAHTIKAVVTDKSGNVTEQQISVNVKNTLVSFSIPDDKLWSGESYTERGFVFLSNDEGKVIASLEYENGKSYSFKNGEFTGDKFFLSEVIIRSNTDMNENRIWTFSQIERGTKWVLLHEEREDETYAGSATLTFSKIATDAVYHAASNGDQPYVSQTSAVIRLHESPSNLYVERFDPEGVVAPFYGLYSGVTVDATTAIDLSKVNIPLSKATVNLPEGASYANAQIQGYTTSDSYKLGYEISGRGKTTSGSQYSFYYPGTAFPSYYSEIFIETDDFSYSMGTKKILSEVKLLAKDVTFTFNDSKLSYSANGDFDFVAAEMNNDDARWVLILPKGTNVSMPALELPDQLKGFVLPSFGAPTEYTVSDLGEITSYSDLITFITSSTYSIGELYRDGKDYIDIDYKASPNGGRVGSKRNHINYFSF